MIFKYKPYPAYKPSGVEWLGEVPEHWDICRAKSLFQKIERPIKEEDEVVTCFRDGTVTLRRNRRESGFTESLKEIGYKGIYIGDLVIHSMDAYSGAIGVADSNGKGSPVYSVCIPSTQVCVHFYAYLLRAMAQIGWIQSLAKGIRERSSDFRYKIFAEQLVPLFPLPEQTSIADFLDHKTALIDRLIEKKQKLITLLEEQKQAIIHQAITGQIDVRTGRPYSTYKPSSIEWLEEVPRHWEIMRLKSVAHQVLELTGKLQENIPYVALENVESWTGRVTSNCTETTGSQLKLFEEGDVLFGKLRPYLAKVMHAKSCGQCVSEFLVLRTTDRISQHFLDHLLRSKSVIDWINSSAFGAKMPRTDWHFVGNTRLAVPSLQEQNAIADFLDHKTTLIDQLIEKKQKLVTLLEEQKQAIIHQAVTGKIDVREAAAGLQQTNSTTCGDEAKSAFSEQHSLNARYSHGQEVRS